MEQNVIGVALAVIERIGVVHAFLQDADVETWWYRNETGVSTVKKNLLFVIQATLRSSRVGTRGGLG